MEKLLLELKKMEVDCEKDRRELSKEERAGKYDGKDHTQFELISKDGTQNTGAEFLGTRSDFEKRYHFYGGLIIAYRNAWELLLKHEKNDIDVLKADRYFREKIGNNKEVIKSRKILFFPIKGKRI